MEKDKKIFDFGSGRDFDGKKDGENKDQSKPDDPFDSLLNNFLGQTGADEKAVSALKGLLSDLSDDPELKDALQLSPKGVDFSTIYKASKKLTDKISEHSKKDEFKEALESIDKDKLPNLQDVIESQKDMFSSYFKNVVSGSGESEDSSISNIQDEIVDGVNNLFDEMSEKIKTQSDVSDGISNSQMFNKEEFERVFESDDEPETKLQKLMNMIEGDENYGDLQKKIEGFVNNIYEKIIPDEKMRNQMHLYGKVERISRVMNKTNLSTKEEKAKPRKKHSGDEFLFHHKA